MPLDSGPSEYVRALIRSDMEKEAERLYVFKELLKSVDDIENGRTFSADEVKQNMDNYLNEGEQ